MKEEGTANNELRTRIECWNYSYMNLKRYAKTVGAPIPKLCTKEEIYRILHQDNFMTGPLPEFLSNKFEPVKRALLAINESEEIVFSRKPSWPPSTEEPEAPQPVISRKRSSTRELLKQWEGKLEESKKEGLKSKETDQFLETRRGSMRDWDKIRRVSREQDALEAAQASFIRIAKETEKEESKRLAELEAIMKIQEEERLKQKEQEQLQRKKEAEEARLRREKSKRFFEEKQQSELAERTRLEAAQREAEERERRESIEAAARLRNIQQQYELQQQREQREREKQDEKRRLQREAEEKSRLEKLAAEEGQKQERINIARRIVDVPSGLDIGEILWGEYVQLQNFNVDESMQTYRAKLSTFCENLEQRVKPDIASYERLVESVISAEREYDKRRKHIDDIKDANTEFENSQAELKKVLLDKSTVSELKAMRRPVALIRQVVALAILISRTSEVKEDLTDWVTCRRCLFRDGLYTIKHRDMVKDHVVQASKLLKKNDVTEKKCAKASKSEVYK